MKAFSMDNSVFNNPFVLKTEQYERDTDPIKHSLEQYAHFLHVKHNRSIDECREFVLSTFKKGGVFEFKDKPMKVLERGENGDRELKETTVRKFIQEVNKRKLILAPTWTAYKPTSEEVSFLSDNIELGIANRNKAKKKMYAAESKGDKAGYIYHKGDQSNQKTRNNSLSGAQCTASTVLFNRTGHSTLTSICRNTSGFGNVNNERIITGNRHYRDPQITLNNINSVVCNTNYRELKNTMEKYDLKYPSIEDTFNCVIYSSRLYWKGDGAEKYIYNFIEKLSPIQRAAFVYTGDMHHLRIHNEQFVRKMLTELTKKITDKIIENPLGVIKGSPESFLFLAHQICTDEVKGIGMEHTCLSEQNKNTLAATILHVAYVVNEYADFIKTFLVTKNLPPSVAYLPSMIRRSALASDTDSTLFTVKDWIVWYCGKIDFTSTGIAIQAAMTFFASSSIVNVLAVMSANIGVDKKHLWRIAMKSEFRFDVFVVTMLGKHYFALIGCQEGSVYEKHKVEIKGVHLISSQITKQLTTLSEKMMVDIMYDIMNKGTVSAKEYVDRVKTIEQKVLSEIRAGNKEYLKAASIKDAQSYGLSETESPFQLHTFWQSTFGKKYGLMPEPPYRTVKISLNLDGQKKLKEWLDKMNDQELATQLRSWFALKQKKDFNTFVIPEEIFTSRGLLEEIRDVINANKIVTELCASFYLVLETLDLFFVGEKKNIKLVSDLYPD